MDYGMMIGVNTPSTGRLPEGYTELEYIESTGTQRINTEYYVNSNTEIDIVFEITGTVSSSFANDAIFGARISHTSSDSFGCFIRKENGNLALNYAGNDTGEISGTSTSGKRHIYNKGKVFYQNDSVVYTFNGTLTKGSHPIHLFASKVNLSNATFMYSKQRTYHCQFIESGVAVRDYVPAIRHSDGEVGLYDLVNGVMYGNAGTGEFIAGPKLGVDVAREVEQIFVEGEGKALINTNLYNYGDECTALTGGFTLIDFTGNSASYCTATKNSDSLTLALANGNSSTWRKRGFGSANKIDFSNYNKLYVEYDCVSSLSGNSKALVGANIAISSSLKSSDNYMEHLDDTITVIELDESNQGSAGINCNGNVVSVDISDVNTTAYLAIYATQGLSSGSYNATIKRVWLEGESETVQGLIAREVVEGWVEVDLVARQFFFPPTIDLLDQSVCGGWKQLVTGGNGGSVSYSNNKITYRMNGSGWCAVSGCSVNSVDVTGYSKLCVEGTYTRTTANTSYKLNLGLGFNNSKSSSDWSSGYDNKNISVSSTSGTFSFYKDITADTGEKQINIFVNEGYTGASTATITKLWLEK